MVIFKALWHPFPGFWFSWGWSHLRSFVEGNRAFYHQSGFCPQVNALRHNCRWWLIRFEGPRDSPLKKKKSEPRISFGVHRISRRSNTDIAAVSPFLVREAPGFFFSSWERGVGPTVRNRNSMKSMPRSRHGFGDAMWNRDTYMNSGNIVESLRPPLQAVSGREFTGVSTAVRGRGGATGARDRSSRPQMSRSFTGGAIGLGVLTGSRSTVSLNSVPWHSEDFLLRLMR